MSEFPNLSFSTSWNWRGSDSGERVAREILGLGFSKVELNYRVTRRMLEDITPLVERGELEVSSVHCVFPAEADPRFDTDSRLLGYRDGELRARALELAIGSADSGARLGARALVVHPGVLPWDELPPVSCGLSGPALDEELKRRWREHGPRSEEYLSLFREFNEYRERGMGGERERILESLEALAEHVSRHCPGMMIGIENRPMSFQIPNFEEMDWFLERLEGAPLGMWLDTGHGAIMRNMGFCDDVAEASRHADRLVGMHIHDVEGVDDHFAPYRREGLDRYLGLIERSPIKVLELGAKNSREEAVEGARRLSAALAARAGRKAVPGPAGAKA
jgi:sugar phosphate isomerase/epimerase